MKKSISKKSSSHIILCPDETKKRVNNYVIVEIEGTGFVVIKQKIDAEL